MNEIRARVESEQYEVDPAVVAQALIERLLAGRAACARPLEPSRRF